MADAHEAFPDDASMIPPTDKRDAFAQATLRAPYEVVYRAALTSATDAKLNLVSNDKQRGTMLAMSFDDKSPGPHVGSGLKSGRYFYAIRVTEKGPKRTEVLIMAKAQFQCLYENAAGYGNVLAAGLLTPILQEEKRFCETYSKIHWADDKTENKAFLSSLMASIQRQLVKAGYE